MKIYRVFSPGVRFCHWIIALCMVVLFVTGLYIGNPGYIGTQGQEPTMAVTRLFSMEMIRYIHFIAAAVFIAALVVRFYLLFTYRGNRLFPNFFSREYYKGALEVMLYYGFLKKSHKHYLRNPLAATTYVGIYVLMILEAVTGLAMYVMIRPNSFWAGIFGPVNNILGNEYITHIVHHGIAWVFAVFLIAHIYLVFLNDVVEQSGELSSIVSGQKHFHEGFDDYQEKLLVHPDKE